MSSTFRRATILTTLVAFLSTALAVPASAAIVGTTQALQANEQALAAAADAANLERVRAGLARADVQQQLVRMGVDPAAAEARVASLTSAELARLAQEIERAPAGGDVLGIIGLVFVVLLVLEYVGAIDIFKRVP